MAASIQDILETNRRRFFVGRARELAEIERLFSATSRRRLVFLAAPGGFGKSSLLAEIKARVREQGVVVAHVDARDHEAVPVFVAAAIRNALDAARKPNPDARVVLLVDTFEHWAPVEAWFYTTFLLELASSIRIVLAGRKPPSARWRADLGWVDLMRIVELVPLDKSDTRDYLALRMLDKGVWERIWQLCRGNPLILALAADVCEQLGAGALDSEHGKDLLQELMLELILETQSTRQADALHAAVVVRVLSQPALEAMLPGDDVAELYTWLGQLSFITRTANGLFPHDLVRDALSADLRRRHPDRLEELIQRAERFFGTRLTGDATAPAHRILSEISYLSRHGAAPAKLIALSEADPVYFDAGTSADVEQITRWIETLLGTDQRELFEYWYPLQPYNLAAIRDANGEMAGFSFFVDFGLLNAAQTQRDPIIDACRRFVVERGLAPGRRASLCRFWLDRRHILSPSSVQGLVLNQVMGRAVVDGVDWCGVLQADDEITRAIANMADHEIVPETLTMLGATRALVTLHDFAREPVADWMIRTNRRIRGVPAATAEPPELAQVRDWVKHALRYFARPDRLRENSLLYTSLACDPATGEQRSVEVLRTRIVSASRRIGRTAKTARYHKILEYSYFKPAKSQLAAAEILNMASSTYYRHLANAVELLSFNLHQEILAASSASSESNLG